MNTDTEPKTNTLAVESSDLLAHFYAYLRDLWATIESELTDEDIKKIKSKYPTKLTDKLHSIDECKSYTKCSVCGKDARDDLYSFRMLRCCSESCHDKAKAVYSIS